MVSVPVNGDASNEANETFTVNLSNPTNSTILDGEGLGTITNDDGVPQISVNDVTLRAARPKFAALDNAKLADAGFTMPSWRDAIGRYLSAA